VYPKRLLDGWVERYRAHFHGRFYDAVLTSVVRFLARRYDPPAHADP
jgi:hypothetical protein